MVRIKIFNYTRIGKGLRTGVDMKAVRTFWVAFLLLAQSVTAFSAQSVSTDQTNGSTVGSISTEPVNLDQFDFGLLWQIDNGLSTPSFLFGTMHVEDPRVTELPQPVQDAFNSSTSLTTEALLELEQILQVGPELLLVDGSNLQGLIGEELYQRVTSAMSARGLMPEMASLLKPWAVALFLSQPQSKSGLFLDRKLYHMAQQNDKPVFGLETMAEQLAVFKTMALADQITLLEETLAQLNMIPEVIERLTVAYLQRDLAALAMIANEQFTGSTVQQQLKQKLVIDRNIKMVNRMQGRLEEGGAFIAIGALHLTGPDGVLSKLKQMGYKVTRVY